MTLHRIALSPWSREASDREALAVLDARCVEMDAYVSTVRRRDGKWMIRAGRDNDHVVSVTGHALETTIEYALNLLVETHPKAWTADEILAVAAQSGISVERA